MRTVLSRPLLIGALLAAALVPSGVASAETSSSCPKESSKVLVSGSDDANRLWLYHVEGSTRWTVCLHVGTGAIGGLAIVADTQSNVIPPDVDVSDNPAVCTFDVPGADLSAPVRFHLAIEPSLNAVCITLGTSNITVQFSVGETPGVQLPLLEVWRDGGANWGLLDVAGCPSEYLRQAVFHEQSDCMATNQRLFPPL